MERAHATDDAAVVPRASENGIAVRVDPDLDFIRAIGEHTDGSFKRCFQCGTCSATCDLSPDVDPFPRKEMAWAAWGRKDKLLADGDVWLCHQCNDCSAHCPRGGRPGDMMAAVREACVRHYAFPRFLAHWVAQPRYAPLLLAIPAGLLALALAGREMLAQVLGYGTGRGERIVFSYSRTLPHWLVNAFFLLFTALALVAVVVGALRYWRALKTAHSASGKGPPRRGVLASFFITIRRVVSHERFLECDTARTRALAHRLVLFGFIGLFVVSLWAMTARINPVIPDGFVYPFDFFSPWKMLANLGGIAVLAGCVVMIRDRAREGRPGGGTNYSDGMLLATIAIVVLTGFVTEVFHYIRLEPHRHAAYFIHLVFVFALLMYLPYSKFAHVVYRTVAMTFAEHTGRLDASPVEAGKEGA